MLDSTTGLYRINLYRKTMQKQVPSVVELVKSLPALDNNIFETQVWLRPAPNSQHCKYLSRMFADCRIRIRMDPHSFFL